MCCWRWSKAIPITAHGETNVRVAQVGDGCSDTDGSDYGETQNANIVKFGKHQICSSALPMPQLRPHIYADQGDDTLPNKDTGSGDHADSGTHRPGQPSEQRVKGHKEDTIVQWLLEAGEHAQSIEAELLRVYRIERGQLDVM